MLYYQTICGVCFKVPDNAHFSAIVAEARKATNTTGTGKVMIEDCHPCSFEDYVDYLESKIVKMKSLLDDRDKTITRLQMLLPISYEGLPY